MKRFIPIIIVTIILLCNSIMSFAAGNAYKAIGTNKLRVATHVRVGDMWADNWNTTDYKVATTIANDKFVITLFSRKDEAWNYYCKITLKDFVIPDKKAIKAQQKLPYDFNYQCEVEFFYNVEYPSVEECFANYGGFIVNSKDPAAKRRTVDGSIILNSYFFTAGDEFGDNQDEVMIAELSFDEVGYGIYFIDHLIFPKK